jgi:hypothetical protein
MQKSFIRTFRANPLAERFCVKAHLRCENEIKTNGKGAGMRSEEIASPQGRGDAGRVSANRARVASFFLKSTSPFLKALAPLFLL